MAYLQLDDIDLCITKEAKLAVADMVLAWAALDTMISYWVLLLFGMPMDTGSILLGNMDTKTKITRLKQFFQHHGNAKEAALAQRLSKSHEKFVDARNTIAHRRCFGMQKSDPTRLMFSSTKHILGEVGKFEILAIDLSEIRAATKFASDAEKSIFRLTEPLQGLPQQAGE